MREVWRHFTSLQSAARVASVTASFGAVGFGAEGFEAAGFDGGGVRRRGVRCVLYADRLPVDSCQNEDARPVGFGRDRERERGVHPTVRGERGEQRLVLDTLLGRRERSLVFDVSVGEVAADRGQGIGVAALVVDRLDEHPGAVVGGPEERGRVTAVIGDRRQMAHRIATRGEHTLHEGRVDDATRRAEREVDGRADRGTESERTDHIEGKVRADVDPRQRDQQDCTPREAPKPAREIGRDPGRERGRDRRVPGRVPVARDVRTTHDHVLQQVERAAPLHEIAHEVRHDIGADAGREDRQRHPPAPEGQRERSHGDDGVQRAHLHHRLERDAEAVGQVVHQAEDVELDPARAVHARDRRARAEDREPEYEPGEIGRMPLAGDQARMCSERSPNNEGAKTRSVKCQLPSAHAKRSRYSPARIGCRPRRVTWSTVKYDRAVAVVPATVTVTLVI